MEKKKKKSYLWNNVPHLFYQRKTVVYTYSFSFAIRYLYLNLKIVFGIDSSAVLSKPHKNPKKKRKTFYYITLRLHRIGTRSFLCNLMLAGVFESRNTTLLTYRVNLMHFVTLLIHLSLPFFWKVSGACNTYVIYYHEKY